MKQQKQVLVIWLSEHTVGYLLLTEQKGTLYYFEHMNPGILILRLHQIIIYVSGAFTKIVRDIQILTIVWRLVA